MALHSIAAAEHRPENGPATHLRSRNCSIKSPSTNCRAGVGGMCWLLNARHCGWAGRQQRQGVTGRVEHVLHQQVRSVQHQAALHDAAQTSRAAHLCMIQASHSLYHLPHGFLQSNRRKEHGQSMQGGIAVRAKRTRVL